jgi:hypothetical protein
MPSYLYLLLLPLKGQSAYECSLGEMWGEVKERGEKFNGLGF